MAGEAADLVFTDPPYNVDYEGYTEDRLTIQGDQMSRAQFKQFLENAFRSYRAVAKPRVSMYVCHSSFLATGISKRHRDRRVRSPVPDHLGEEHFRVGFRPL